MLSSGRHIWIVFVRWHVVNYCALLRLPMRLQSVFIYLFFFFLIFLLKRLGRFSPGPKYKFVCFVEEQQKKNHNGGDPLEGSARVCPHARWDPWRLHNGIPTQTNNIPFVLLHSIYTCSYIGRPNLDVESLHTRMRDPFFFAGYYISFHTPRVSRAPATSDGRNAIHMRIKYTLINRQTRTGMCIYGCPGTFLLFIFCVCLLSSLFSVFSLYFFFLLFPHPSHHMNADESSSNCHTTVSFFNPPHPWKISMHSILIRPVLVKSCRRTTLRKVLFGVAESNQYTLETSS